MFPDWLREIFPRTAETTHTLGVMQWAGSPGRSPAVETRKQRQGHSGTKTIRQVCKRCNETWLSNEIEKIAKPILLPLINGERAEIDSRHAADLATWAAKTVMTAEHVHPSKGCNSPSRKNVAERKCDSTGRLERWIGTYHGLAWSELAIQQHAAKLRFPTVDNGNPAGTQPRIHDPWNAAVDVCRGQQHLAPHVGDHRKSVGNPSSLPLPHLAGRSGKRFVAPTDCPY